MALVQFLASMPYSSGVCWVYFQHLGVFSSNFGFTHHRNNGFDFVGFKIICSLLIWESTRIGLFFCCPPAYALVIKNKNNGFTLKRTTILFSLFMAECFKLRVLITASFLSFFNCCRRTCPVCRHPLYTPLNE